MVTAQGKAGEVASCSTEVWSSPWAVGEEGNSTSEAGQQHTGTKQVEISWGRLEGGAPKGPVSSAWQLFVSSSILVAPEKSSEVMGGWKEAIPYPLYCCLCLQLLL